MKPSFETARMYTGANPESTRRPVRRDQLRAGLEIDVPDINKPGVALVEAAGMKPSFETARMYTGANPERRLCRPVRRDQLRAGLILLTASS